MSRLKEIETKVQRVESRVDTHLSGQMAVQGQDVIARSSQQVQTLQTVLHETELHNQHLQTRVTEMESHVDILMSYMLWMEDRLTVLEKRLPGPPPGPQLKEIETRVQQVESSADTHPSGQMAVQGQDVIVGLSEQVESRVDTHPSGQMAVQGQDVIVGLSEHVQTLQTALHETELQNQQLWTRVTEMESHVGIVMSHMLWMEERLTVLEK
nr:hypothetical protein [Tanacetum cinerariifolium]